MLVLLQLVLEKLDLKLILFVGFLFNFSSKKFIFFLNFWLKSMKYIIFGLNSLV